MRHAKDKYCGDNLSYQSLARARIGATKIQQSCRYHEHWRQSKLEQSTLEWTLHYSNIGMIVIRAACSSVFQFGHNPLKSYIMSPIKTPSSWLMNKVTIESNKRTPSFPVPPHLIHRRAFTNIHALLFYNRNHKMILGSLLPYSYDVGASDWHWLSPWLMVSLSSQLTLQEDWILLII